MTSLLPLVDILYSCASAAEAALAVELLESEGLQAAADKLGISRNTGKTQLAAIFQKAGVRRQSELVKRILAMALIGAKGRAR